MIEREREYGFQTRLLHEGMTPDLWQGSTLPPIFQAASHVHPTAESLSATFGGHQAAHIYGRLTNPTNAVLERKIALLEGGKGAVYMSSGMAAVSNSCMALLRAGDDFVSSRSLFMSTYLLFQRILPKYDIRCHLVDPLDPEAMEAAITEKTRFLYMETIGNPVMDVPDLGKAAAVAHKHGLPLVVDNTLASPYLCRPIEHGADLVIHSTTKYLSGHGDAVGGIVVDGGRFDWSASDRFPDLQPFVDRKGDLAMLDKIWREHHINFGTTGAPLHSYLTVLGLDTLGLRMERHQINALHVAGFLEKRPEVSWVNYPGLAGHSSRDVALQQFRGKGFGSLLTFGLSDQAACFSLINNLQLIYHLANLGDCRSLIIHPASSQYLSFPDDERERIGIRSDMVRLSVGIEDPVDICNDLSRALGCL